MFAELILENANIITVDTRYPTAEAVAIKGGKILAVGNKDLVGSFKEPGTRVIDCQGKTLVPGFNDAHCHVFSFVRKLLSVDLSPLSVCCIEDIKALIFRKAQNLPQGCWLSGTDYNDFYLAEKRHPTRWEIDEVAPDHPVVLSHRSLHACVLNSMALKLAGITRETPEPPDAQIERDLKTGEPNGILFEMLGYIREKVMPPLSEAELVQGISLANQSFLSQGITSLQEATVVNSLSQWQKFKRFKENGSLKSRLYVMPGIQALSQFEEAGLNFGDGDDNLRVGGVKIILSGSGGQLYPTQTELNKQVLQVHQAGFQVAIHAVQENAVEEAVTALEYVQNQSPGFDRRHRIEHCGECPPRLVERLGKLRIVIVTQPSFLYYGGERYLATVTAEQQKWLYRIKSLLNSGVVVAASSDCPVVINNPLVGISAATTRKTQSGQYILPEEAITVEQALAMYTLNAAYASFEENIKGSITPGKVADVVLLSRDLTKVPAEEIKNIKLEMTIIGGEVVWEA